METNMKTTATKTAQSAQKAAKAAKPAKAAAPKAAKAAAPKGEKISLTDKVRKLLADGKPHANTEIAKALYGDAYSSKTINTQKLCEALVDRNEAKKVKAAEGGRISFVRVAAKKAGKAA